MSQSYDFGTKNCFFRLENSAIWAQFRRIVRKVLPAPSLSAEIKSRWKIRFLQFFRQFLAQYKVFCKWRPENLLRNRFDAAMNEPFLWAVITTGMRLGGNAVGEEKSGASSKSICAFDEIDPSVLSNNPIGLSRSKSKNFSLRSKWSYAKP